MFMDDTYENHNVEINNENSESDSKDVNCLSCTLTQKVPKGAINPNCYICDT